MVCMPNLPPVWIVSCICSIFCSLMRLRIAEVMTVNAAIRALIREDKAHQIYSIIQTSGRLGMRTMNQALSELTKMNLVHMDEALAHSSDVDDLKRQLQGT